MITKLDVWLTVPSGQNIKAGALAVKEPGPDGALQGQFRYDQKFLHSSKAFALDPLHLPLGMQAYDAHRPHSGVHGVFEDSLPDDWGRKIMARRYKLGRGEQRVPHLLRLLGGQGMGALVYTEGQAPASLPDGVSIRHLAELAMAAEKFEKDPFAMADDELAMLLRAGSSPGGARPKALLVDKGEACLAKFASIKDTFDVVGLEAAAMELGRRAGLETAATRLEALSSSYRCLLVKRFDINKAGGRNHLISMQSLLKADGYYNAGYRDMAEVIKHVSGEPRRDLHALYRQMVFNVMIGNTDDHLKNFCMLHDETGWRLCPAFDLVPNIGLNQEHVLHISFSNRPADIAPLLAEATCFGIKRRQVALDIIKDVSSAVSTWPDVFASFDVPDQDAKVIGRDIKHRLEKLSSFDDSSAKF